MIDHNEPLKSGLQDALDNFRAKRGFDPAEYANAKSVLINDYFRNNKLDTAILGMSGGIDSAVVGALLRHAQTQDNSPIKNIISATVPADSEGVTGQTEAATRAHDVLTFLGLEEKTIDITAPHKSLMAEVERTFGLEGDVAAKEQSVAHTRSMSLAYTAALHRTRGQRSLLVGTTNRDEGAYIGYVGKYSDGLVDLQVIPDLHKSEVFALGRYYGLPDSVMNVTPTGDLYDGRTDTEFFGFSYDFLEFYLNYLELSKHEQNQIRATFDKKDEEQFVYFAWEVEKLHQTNSFKYKGNEVTSPAVHLNIMPTAVPGGWVAGKFEEALTPPPEDLEMRERIFPGYFEQGDEVAEIVTNGVEQARMGQFEANSYTIDLSESCDFTNPELIVVDNLLTSEEAETILDDAKANAPWKVVGPMGLQGFDPLKDPAVGAWWSRVYNSELTDMLWDRLRPHIPALKYTPEGSSVYAKYAKIWRAVGINPKLSFILYRPEDKGILVPHYDSPFIPENDTSNRKTLKSLLIYLEDRDEGAGGLTRFIRDPQASTPPLKRDMSDWDDMAQDEQVSVQVPSKAGMAAAFDHALLHDSGKLAEGSDRKIIIRTDIIYQPVVSP